MAQFAGQFLDAAIGIVNASSGIVAFTAFPVGHRR